VIIDLALVSSAGAALILFVLLLRGLCRRDTG
jgi:hypothetical protein